MPRVYLTQASKRKADDAEWEKRFRAAVLYHLELKGMSREGLGIKLGIPATTMRSHIREPLRARTGVLLQMMDELRFDDAERMNFFARKVKA